MKNKELRAKAREHLGGGIFQNAWLLTLVAFLLYDVIIGAVSYTVIGTILLAGPLEYGVTRIIVSNARGKGNPDIAAIFSGFSEDFGNTLLLGFLKGLFIFLWSLLLIIPGIIKTYSYAMSTFIQQDAENKDWKLCLEKSIEMMNGKKWKLFLLDLSFIGWYLLGILCLGVGVLFVIPYHEQARAEFYEDVKNAVGKTDGDHEAVEAKAE